jgi:glycosyltransferase involved in cell wall biosynthesis
MPRLRILHVLSLNVVGGVERLFDAWLAHPAAAALEQHVLSLRRDAHPRFVPTLRAHAASVSFANHWRGVRLPRRPAFLRARHIARALDAVRPDAVLLWNALGDAELLAALRRAGAAVGFYEHGAALMRAADDPEAAGLARMDAILCGCRASQRVMELRFGARADGIRVITNPVIGAAAGAPAELLPPRPGRPLRLGFAGRITPLKGLPLALHAARHVLEAGTDCELRIAGDGADLPPMQRLAERLRLTGKALFLGVVRDMPAFYREIDILLAPSLRETMPLVCMEAAWAGRPAIAPAINGVPEIVLDGRTGFVIPPTLPLAAYAEFGGTSLDGVAEEYYDPISDAMKPAGLVRPEEIAERALRLAKDPEEYLRLARAASARAREEFTMDRYVEGMAKALKDLAGGTPAG